MSETSAIKLPFAGNAILYLIVSQERARETKLTKCYVVLVHPSGWVVGAVESPSPRGRGGGGVSQLFANTDFVAPNVVGIIK